MNEIRLSPSSLGDFKSCPRCFWMDKNQNIKRPRGIFPSLPGGMDRILKPWYDSHRAKGILPPEVAGKVDGKLFADQAMLKKWRYWKTGLSCQVGDATVGGALDDLLVNADGLFSPFDYKTRGSEPKTDGSEYYGHRIDCYALLCRENNMPVTEKGYLAYYWPRCADVSGPMHCGFIFDVEIKQLEALPERSIELITRAAECLQGEEPAPDPACEYCVFAGDHYDHKNKVAA